MTGKKNLKKDEKAILEIEPEGAKEVENKSKKLKR